MIGEVYMKHVFARCLVALIFLAMPLGTLTEGYVWVIPPQFDDAWDFREGLAAVMIDDKWGFIDGTGQMVVPLQYDEVNDFHDGMAVVIVGDKNQVIKAAFAKGGVIDTRTWVYVWEYGFIDKTGKEVISPQYAGAADFSDGLARIRVHDGETKKWGFIDKTGKEVVSPKYDWVEEFNDGLAMVFIGEGRWGDVDIVDGGKWGFIDKTGMEIVPIEYAKVGKFREGRASIIKDNKLGFIDETGAVVIPLTYEIDWPPLMASYREVMPYFSEGLAAIWNGNMESGPYGYIDRNGKAVIPFEYSYAAPFSEGLAYVSEGSDFEVHADVLEGKFGFIDKTGEVVVPLVYDCDYEEHGILLEEYFVGGFACVGKGIAYEAMQYGMIDRTGTVAVPIEYDWIWQHGFHWNFDDGLALVGFGNDSWGSQTWESCGLVDKSGKEVVAIGRYDEIAQFSEGYARVWHGAIRGQFNEPTYGTGTYGFINTAGKEVVPCIFEDARSFSEGLAAVKVDGKWGYIAITE